MTHTERANMTAAQRQQRANIRNFFYPATYQQVEAEIVHRNARGDLWAVKCLREILDEFIAEGIDCNRN